MLMFYKYLWLKLQRPFAIARTSIRLALPEVILGFWML